MSRPRIISLALILVLILTGLAILWRSLTGSGARQSVLLLPDGRRVELVGVTYGKSHQLQVPKIRQFMQGIAPQPMRRMFGPSFSATFGFASSNGLAPWLMCYDPATKQYQSEWLDELVALDEHGCEFASGGSGQTGDTFYSALVMELPAFPRRQSRFTCILYQGRDLQRVALGKIELDVPAAARVQPVESWQPDALPAARTNGSQVIRLKGFSKDRGPIYEVLEDGQPSPGRWEAAGWRFEDVTGNTGPSLCREETAWRLKTWFFRGADALFATNEISTFQGLKPPAPGSVTSLQGLNLAGTSPSLLEVAGPGDYEYSNNVLTASTPWQSGMGRRLSSSSGAGTTILRRSSGETSVHLGGISLLPQQRLLIRFRAGGKVVASARLAGAAGGRSFLDVTLPDGLETVEMDVILHTGFEVEFYVDPRRFFPEGQPVEAGGGPRSASTKR